jgi:hypothetical protein
MPNGTSLPRNRLIKAANPNSSAIIAFTDSMLRSEWM